MDRIPTAAGLIIINNAAKEITLISIPLGHVTNNLVEAIAVLAALETTNRICPQQPVVIWTDSANTWNMTYGHEINKETPKLQKRIQNLITPTKIIHQLPSHTWINDKPAFPLNDVADMLAKISTQRPTINKISDEAIPRHLPDHYSFTLTNTQINPITWENSVINANLKHSTSNHTINTLSALATLDKDLGQESILG